MILVLVRQDSRRVWILSAVYASPNPLLREDLWNYIIRLGRCINLPWVLVGDFNHVLLVNEKSDGFSVNIRNMLAFQNVVVSCSLVDMDSLELPSHGLLCEPKQKNIKEQLDRGLCNQAFLSTYLAVMIIHLPRTKFDHQPILIREPVRSTFVRFERPFRMLEHGSPTQLLRAWSAIPGNWNSLLPKLWRCSEAT